MGHPNGSTPASHQRAWARLDLRLTAEQKERWTRCATANDMSLSEWLRRAADDTADRLFPRQARITRVYPRSSDCVRWMYHTAGVYCPGCDTVIAG